MQRKTANIHKLPVHPASFACFDIFAGVDELSLRKILALGHPRFLRCGQTLFRQGEVAASFYVLVNGHLKITQTNADGQQIVLRILGAGDPSGITRALRRDDYPGTATALQDVLLIAWNTSDWDIFLRLHPNLAINMMQVISGRMQEAHERVKELSTSDARSRIAAAILRLGRRQGTAENGGYRIDFPITKQDIAEMSGTTLHTASRILAEWDRIGLIETGRQRLVICRLSGLEGMIGDSRPHIFPIETPRRAARL